MGTQATVMWEDAKIDLTEKYAAELTNLRKHQASFLLCICREDGEQRKKWKEMLSSGTAAVLCTPVVCLLFFYGELIICALQCHERYNEKAVLENFMHLPNTQFHPKCRIKPHICQKLHRLLLLNTYIDFSARSISSTYCTLMAVPIYQQKLNKRGFHRRWLLPELQWLLLLLAALVKPLASPLGHHVPFPILSPDFPPQGR